MNGPRNVTGGSQERVRLRRIGAVLVQSARDLVRDGGTSWAAAIAYYSLLSTFPLLLAIAAIAAYFVQPEWAVEQATQLLSTFLPRGSMRIEEIVQGAIDARQGASIVSIAALLWSGSRVFGVVTRALNLAYGADERYGIVRRVAIELAMTVTVGLFFVAALASRVWLRLLWRQWLGGDELSLLFRSLMAIVPGAMLVVAFFLVYRFVPRRRVAWQAAAAGSVLATALVLIARPLFLTYLRNFATYNLIYGSLAIVIVLVLWAWLVALIGLYGGEVVAHTQAMLIEGKSAAATARDHRLRGLPHDAGGAERRGVARIAAAGRAALTVGASLLGALLFWRWSGRG